MFVRLARAEAAEASEEKSVVAFARAERLFMKICSWVLGGQSAASQILDGRSSRGLRPEFTNLEESNKIITHCLAEHVALSKSLQYQQSHYYGLG